MKINLIVEGDSDKDFFNHIFSLLGSNLSDLVEIRPDGGKHGSIDILKTYIKLEFSKIGMARDINMGTPQTIKEKLKESLASSGFSIREENPWLTMKKSKVLLLPMGLPGDNQLKKLGITRFTFEDYLLKIFYSSLKSREKFKRKIKSLRQKDIALDRSKDLLRLAVESSLLPERYMSSLLSFTESNLLEIFKPIKDNLEILKDP